MEAIDLYDHLGWRPVECYHSLETYIYFMKARFSGVSLIKIGYSCRPKARARNLQLKFKTNISIIGLVKLRGNYNCRKLERILHNKFADKRVFGEWFHEHEELTSLITKGQYDKRSIIQN